MFQRRQKRFRRRSNGRGQIPHGGSDKRIRPISFISNQPRNNFKNPQSAEKLFEKYNALAKEAMSSGDKTLSENYLQHADHFMRIIEDKNRNKNQNNVNVVNKTPLEGNVTNSGSNDQNSNTKNSKE